MDDRAEESIGEMPTLGREETARTTHGPAWNQDESIGELPTLGPGGIVDKGRKESVRAQQGPVWNPDESIGELTTYRPDGIDDDGRTDGARRWKVGEEILGRYVVERELGQGGMGVVYGCLDKVGGVKVAVKCLPPELSHNSVEMEEVRENFQLVVGLRHPNIAGVRTLEKDNRGEYFLVMDVADGESLRAWLRRKWKAGGVTLAEAVGILRQVASALDYAHGEKVVHRDVKPGNVMIDARGCVKVLDFGLASQIRTSLSRASHVYRGTSGTGPYMAPEQWRGRRQDGKTDQYALGVMAYEMLAGHLPFENDEVSVLREVVLKEEPEDIPGVPEGAMAAIWRAMAKSAADRFPACGAFVDALESAASQGRASTPCEPGKWPAAGAAKGTSAGKPAGTTARSESSPYHRSIGGWVAAAVLAAAVGAGVWWGGWGREEARPEGLPHQTRPEAAFPAAGETPAPPVEEAPAGPVAEDPMVLPPEGAPRSELEDALARLEARRDALVQEGYAVADPERAPVEEALAALEERIDAALEAEAEKARAEEREGRRSAAQRAADLEALGDLKKAVDRRVASLDPTWQDGSFGQKRKAIEEARKKLETCTDVSSLAQAKELRGDIYDAADWIERNTPARSGLSDAEKVMETLAGECAEADAGKLAGGSFHKADRARKEGEKLCDAGRYEDAAAQYAAAKGFYEAALKEARSAKADACVEEARTYAKSKMWDECMKAAGNALDWDADNAEAKQLKAEAEREDRAAKVEQGLDAAKGAERRSAWEEVLAAAGKVLKLDAGNEEALRLKKEAEAQLKPILIVFASLPGGASHPGEPGAKLKIGAQTYILPHPFDCSGEATVGPGEVMLEKDGTNYAGTLARMKVDWKGERQVAVPLEAVIEEARPECPPHKAGDMNTILLPGGVTMEMVWCPPGTFTMGSPTGTGFFKRGRESARDDDETQHQVTLTEGFWMAKTEVTQKQWKSVMGTTVRQQRDKSCPSCSLYGEGDDYPMYYVSWEEAQEFCKRAGNGLQLPTEAQWEYACRAGSTGAYGGTGDLETMGWYSENSGSQPHPVGKKQRNAWGLYDMHGNVLEWCADWYTSDLGDLPLTDPKEPLWRGWGSGRVHRGGCWNFIARGCRSANRSSDSPNFCHFNLGFRPVRVWP